MLQKLELFPGRNVRFEYTNHAGETETRTARFIDAEYGMVAPYYPTPRLLLRMWCYDRKAERSFDPTKINFDTWLIGVDAP